DAERPAWHADYFVGVPAPAGAALVMLPVYAGFLGVPQTRVFALLACVYAVVIALLLVSRLPVYSGKHSGGRVRRDIVMPLMLAVVLYVLLLASYTWETLTASAVAYLAFLPFSMRAYARRAAREERATGEGK